MKVMANDRDYPVYEFGPFRLDTAQRALLQGDKVVPLWPKALDALLVLVQNSGRILEKDFLLETIWPDSTVEENNLAKAISEIRKALGERPQQQRYIVTVAGRGYRFAASVKPLGSGALAAVGSRRAESEDASAGAAPSVASIAVLPFICLGTNGDDGFLAVGMADALITRLGNLRQIVIRPTNAIAKYAESGVDAAVAGAELKVDWVISGSIRRAGAMVRVTVQLVHTADKSLHWADKFDEPFTDIFAVEDAISRRVAAALELKLTGHRKLQLAQRATENSEAYQHYLKGRYFWSKRSVEDLHKAIAHFEQAVERDPRYALAHAGLADAYVLLGLQSAIMGGLAPKAMFPRAEQAVLKALQIDDTLAEAHAVLAHIQFFYHWDWLAAEQEFQQALQLDPHYATVHHWYAMALTGMGQHQKALQEINRAQELEPLSLIINANTGFILYFARRFDDAIAHLQSTVQMEPRFVVAHHRLGLAYAAKGRHYEAIREFQEAENLSNGAPLTLAMLGYAYALSGNKNKAQTLLERLHKLAERCYVSAYCIAEIHASLGDRDQTFEWLEKAYTERPSFMTMLNVNPRWDSFRSDRRFQELLLRIGLWPSA